MIIQCEKCNRKFKVDDSRIISPGSKVRCSKCGHVFFVEKKESTYDGERAEPPQEDFSFEEEGKTIGEHDAPAPNDESRQDYDVMPAPDENNQPKETGEYDLDEVASHDLDEITTEGSFDDEDSPSTMDEENSASENDMSDLSLSEEPDSDIEEVTADEGNWEEFVTISKNEEKIDDFKIKDVTAQTGQDSDFNWDNLRIDNETDDVPEHSPAMFEDEEADPEDPGQNSGRDIDERSEETVRRPLSGKTPETLAVDMDVLTNNPHAFKSPVSPSGQRHYGSMRTYPSRPKSGRGLFAGIAYGIITIAVLVVIICASYIILLHTGVVSKESSDKLLKLVESVVPIRFAEPLKNDVIVTEHSGKWMDTRNGSLYVISGMITNKSDNPVNFVKIRSEFLSAGQILYENEVYAGNTFTDRELKVSPLQDILLKLKKRNGNIDYYNTNKLAGLNYNIQPGESIPFYTVFPSTSRVLGLKYELQVADYEDSSSK